MYTSLNFIPYVSYLTLTFLPDDTNDNANCTATVLLPTPKKFQKAINKSVSGHDNYFQLHL